MSTVKYKRQEGVQGVFNSYRPVDASYRTSGTSWPALPPTAVLLDERGLFVLGQAFSSLFSAQAFSAAGVAVMVAVY